MRGSWALSLAINMLLVTGPGAISAGCADYGFKQDIYHIIENKAGNITILPQSPLVTRLGRFVSRWRSEPSLQLEYALALAKTKHPKALAAIASRESQFHKEAVGKKGPWFGAYQVMPKYWGRVPKDVQGQTCQADRVFGKILRMKKGKYHAALWYYNGPGGKEYADDVLQRMRRV